MAQPSESQESKDGPVVPQAQTQAEIKNETGKTEQNNVKSPSSPTSPRTPGVTITKPSLKSQLWPSKKLAAAKVTVPPKEEPSSPITSPAQNESVRRHSQHRPSGQSDAMMSEIGPTSQSEEVANDRKFSMNSDIFFESEVTSPSPILNVSSNRSTSINPPYSQLKGKKNRTFEIKSNFLTYTGQSRSSVERVPYEIQPKRPFRVCFVG